jgi:D-alanyl-lipoteichoic acid acyltransferase DltB (MBOAT superfamily)
VEPIQTNQLIFALLASGLILLAWSKWQRWFLYGLGLVSLMMLISWLSVPEAAVLLGFLLPPYLITRYRWGRQDRSNHALLVMAIIWEVGLFIYLRGYEWVEFSPWLMHPISIIGLSYMLFRVIHLLIDAPFLGEYRLSFIRYSAYISAFWTLLSGPIQRYEDFCQGLTEVGRPETKDLLRHTHRAVNGLLKTVIIAPIFLKSSELGLLKQPGATWLDFIIIFYSYPIYLYLNFSGYTDLIIAITKMCGITTMPENFNRPYLARNIQDFWSRWHISFGVWIRQYIFNVLSKKLLSTLGFRHEALALGVAVVITFIIIGAWHGTTSNFLIFGLLHGGAIILTSSYGTFLKRVLGKSGRRAFEGHYAVKSTSMFLCFNFVCASVLLFANQAGEIYTTFHFFLLN